MGPRSARQGLRLGTTDSRGTELAGDLTHVLAMPGEVLDMHYTHHIWHIC